MNICVKTSDKYLEQKIRLMLSECSFTEEAKADIVLCDDEHSSPFNAVKMSRTEDCELTVPFSKEALLSVISGENKKSQLLTFGERSVEFKGKKIALTELEFSLLKALADARGEFIQRDELLEKVWGQSASDGILNVYIHYLREKLETEGEKVIISSRKYGYKISERYFL